jgi:hypothetical protein
VDELFAEAKIPIAERQDYAYLLQFDGSYRYSDYSNGPHTNSYGLGMEWAPIKGYTLRGSYQQAIRAANIIELFQQQGNNLYGGQDPCAGPNPVGDAEQCLRTGLPANLYGSPSSGQPCGQYNFLQGGNPNLTPEKSESYTIGMVLRSAVEHPRFQRDDRLLEHQGQEQHRYRRCAGSADPMYQYRRVLQQHPSRQPGYPVAGRRRFRHGEPTRTWARRRLPVST